MSRQSIFRISTIILSGASFLPILGCESKKDPSINVEQTSKQILNLTAEAALQIEQIKQERENVRKEEEKKKEKEEKKNAEELSEARKKYAPYLKLAQPVEFLGDPKGKYVSVVDSVYSSVYSIKIVIVEPSVKLVSQSGYEYGQDYLLLRFDSDAPTLVPPSKTRYIGGSPIYSEPSGPLAEPIQISYTQFEKILGNWMVRNMSDNPYVKAAIAKQQQLEASR